MHWLQEYCYGLGYQMYPVRMPEVLWGLDYPVALRIIFRRFGIMVIGMEVAVGGNDDFEEPNEESYRRMLLNPGS